MNDLLFITILIALLYYFLAYLPSKKSHPDPSNKPFTQAKSTQTDPEPKTVDFPRPQHIEGPGALTIEDKQELENTLDYLIKDIKDFTNQL